MNNKYVSERRLQKRGKSEKLSQLKQRLYQNNSKKRENTIEEKSFVYSLFLHTKQKRQNADNF